MEDHALVGIVTLLALLLYFFMGLRVGQARGKHGILAPAVSGHPDFDRAFRVQANTLEWLPLFLVSLWLFALAWHDDKIAAGVGLVWIVGRFLYMTSYSKQADKRSTGFAIQAFATGILLFGALGRILYAVFRSGVV